MRPLTLVKPRIVDAWRCHQRGLCCRGIAVELDRVTLTRMHRRLAADASPEAAALDPARPSPVFIPQRGDGSCTFLDDDNLCRYRKRYGVETMPPVCTTFPYLSYLTPAQLRVGLSFRCPTALGLLAATEVVDVVHEPDGEPPTPQVMALAAPGRDYWDADGRAQSPERFWELHRAFEQVFSAQPAKAAPIQKLDAAVRAVGLTVPETPDLPRALLVEGPRGAAGLASLAPLGPVSPTIRHLWRQLDLEPMDEVLPLSGDEDALLSRYLAHRLLAPSPYARETSIRYLIGALYAGLARYAIERARGESPLVALRRVDHLIVHTGWLPLVLSPERGSAEWRPVAALARAWRERG